MPLEGVTTLYDIHDEVKEFVTNGFKPGFQIGLKNFDNIFSTYTGQFITVTGIPSSGKSDFVDQMVVGYNNQYGWKTAFASPENQPTYLHAHKLMRKTWQDMPSVGDIGSDKWLEVTQRVNDNYFFIDMERYTLESVLKKGAELVKRKGIKCLVIDPYNKVRDTNAVSDDVNRYTMDYLAKIETFAKKYDVLVFIVAHPTKMYKGQDGKLKNLRCITSRVVGNGTTHLTMDFLFTGTMRQRLLRLRYSKLSSKTWVKTELKLILLGNHEVALSFRTNRITARS